MGIWASACLSMRSSVQDIYPDLVLFTIHVMAPECQRCHHIDPFSYHVVSLCVGVRTTTTMTDFQALMPNDENGISIATVNDLCALSPFWYVSDVR